MIDLLDILHVRLGTRDLVAADRLAREVVGLELSRVEAGARCCRSDARGHTLVPGGASSFCIRASLPDIPEYRKYSS